MNLYTVIKNHITSFLVERKANINAKTVQDQHLVLLVHVANAETLDRLMQIKHLIYQFETTVSEISPQNSSLLLDINTRWDFQYRRWRMRKLNV